MRKVKYLVFEPLELAIARALPAVAFAVKAELPLAVPAYVCHDSVELAAHAMFAANAGVKVA